MPQVPVSQVNPECLTGREREIVKHIALGKTNPEIAAVLALSVKTVDWHRTNLMKKLDIHTVAGLVRYALLHGLIEEDE
jgi:DNA-binding CsgD family transcriptional regulator